MAKYKVWLTVKDSYGNTKELDAGDILVDFTLGQDELTRIEESLPLDEFLKKTEIDYLATDVEVENATKNTVKYDDFKLVPENTEEVGN